VDTSPWPCISTLKMKAAQPQKVFNHQTIWYNNPENLTTYCNVVAIRAIIYSKQQMQWSLYKSSLLSSAFWPVTLCVN
jgi:hypothetical protein